MSKVYKMDLAGRELSVEIGKVAELANGECIVRYGDTVVLVTATASENQEQVLTSSLFQLIMKKRCIL